MWRRDMQSVSESDDLSAVDHDIPTPPAPIDHPLAEPRPDEPTSDQPFDFITPVPADLTSEETPHDPTE
jgi:hypothetical protein